MRFEIKFSVIFFLLVFLTYWIFQERRADGDEVIVTALEERARNGDLIAIGQLRQEYLKKGELSTADYWLYAGALRGDKVLVDEYARRFVLMSEGQQKVQLRSINTSSASYSQKKALLEKLGQN